MQFSAATGLIEDKGWRTARKRTGVVAVVLDRIRTALTPIVHRVEQQF